jgi:hypothetical protein
MEAALSADAGKGWVPRAELDALRNQVRQWSERAKEAMDAIDGKPGNKGYRMCDVWQQFREIAEWKEGE